MEKLPVYISLGAGVQSSAMALMAAKGDSHPLDSWQDECDGICGV